MKYKLYKMNTYKLSILLFFSSILLVCCKDIKKEYYTDGSLKGECEFKDGVANGLCKMFYEDGKIESEIYYIDGIQHGKATWYYPNGNIDTETNFINGKKEGISKEYYESGELKAEGNYKNDLPDGITKHYYKSGILEAINNYEEGQTKGEYKSYHPNGQLSMVAYQEKDTTIFYVEYDSLGNWVEESRDVMINSEKDDIQLGETYKLHIELTGPVEDSVLVVLSFFGKNHGELPDKEIRLYAKNNKMTIEFEPNKIGEWMVGGSLIINNNTNRSITLNPRLFNVNEKALQ